MQAGPAVPVPVAAAITHATREALANVAAHAGTGEAWVTVRPLAAAPGAEPGVEVTVRDEGAGSTPPGSARPGWASAGPSPNGSPTGVARPR